MQRSWIILALALLVLSGCAGSSTSPKGAARAPQQRGAIAAKAQHTGAVELDKNGDGKLDDEYIPATIARAADVTAAIAAGGGPVPDQLSDLADDASHRTVTDSEKSTWSAKQNALTAGTNYLAPAGSASALTVNAAGFDGNLAPTDNTIQEIVQKLDDLTDGGAVGEESDPVFSAWDKDYTDLTNTPTVVFFTLTDITGQFTGSGPALCADGTKGDCGLNSGGVSFLVSDPPSPADNSVWFNTTAHTLNIATADGLTTDGVFAAWSPVSAFGFTDATGVTADGALNCSVEITPTGANHSWAVTTDGDAGCAVRIAGAAAAATGTWTPGQTIQACVNSSLVASTTTSCTPTIGVVTATAPFTVTTAAPGSTWLISDEFSTDTASSYTKINTSSAVLAVADGVAYDSSNLGSTGWYVHNTDPGSANQQVQAILKTGASSGRSTGLTIRSNGTTGHGCYVDTGSNRFTCEALGGSGTAIYKSFTAGAWAINTAHLVQITVGADNIYKFEADFNDDGNFDDANEQVGTSTNASYAGTKAGIGFRAAFAGTTLDNFKAKVYTP